MVVAPVVGDALQSLSSAIRFGTSLSARTREIAILTVASARKSDFKWYAHEGIGVAAGLTEDELDALRAGTEVRGFDEESSIVGLVVASLATNGTITEGDYAGAERLLGTVGLIDLVKLVGDYLMLDLLMRAFKTPLPSGVDAPFGGQSRDS